MKRRVEGRITIVQEDRVRVMDDDGRGYLFVVKKGAATLDQLEGWRDGRARILVEYSGTPDAGALAERLSRRR